MINFIQKRIGLKLFFSYLMVVLVGAIALEFTASFAAPFAFNRHISDMEAMMGGEGMMGGGMAGGGMMGGSTIFSSFQAAFTEALTTSTLAAGATAVVVSIFVTRRVTAPIHRMTLASRRIAEGHYEERVETPKTPNKDEIEQLAESFNIMAITLEQTEELRRQLIGDAAHELRTPLTTIKGSLEGLIDGVMPPTPETYQQIYREAERMQKLVDDLQELSRVEAGAYQLDLVPLEANQILEVVEKRLEQQFGDKGVTLYVRPAPNLPSLLVDENRIGQVMLNLVGNALQYTPSGGKVEVSAEKRGEEIWFSIKDTGVGIAEEHLPHVFTRFYRADKSRSRAQGGSGIGLTISKHLVETHGGRIWAESEGKEKGSVFIFTLPIKNS